MKSKTTLLRPGRTVVPAVTAALAAAGLIGSAQAAIQTAGDLLVNIDATALPPGPLPSIPNPGTLGGIFQARGGAAATPRVAAVYGNGTKGIQFDGGDFLQHVMVLGGPPISAPAGLTGVNPTMSVEAWVMNPWPDREETIVAWGHRGGPDGRNESILYGFDARWGAIGHWGSPDIGWDPGFNDEFYPPGEPTPGVWHHLAYTYDGTTTRVYADGVLKNSETLGLDTFPLPAITIGAQLLNDASDVEPALRATMTIARLRIHQEALTDGQVANNYNAEVGDFTLGTGSAPAFGPIHRYTFSEAAGPAPSGTTITDSVGTGHGKVLGDGAASSGSRLSLPGGSSGSAAYVDLPNGLISNNSRNNGGSGQFSIEGWTRVTGLQSWSRLFDFGSTTGGELSGPGGGGEGLDYLFVSAMQATEARYHNVSIRNIDPPGADGWDAQIGSLPVLNRDIHWALTWDELAGHLVYYEEGGEAATRDFSPANNPMTKLNDVNCWLGRSNWTGDANTQGEYDEVRIYDRILSADEVRANHLAGPGVVAPPQSVTILLQPASISVEELHDATFRVAVQGVQPYTFQWYSNNVAIAGATSHTLNLLGVPTSANGAQFYCIVGDTIGGTPHSVTSATAVLTVIPDTTPPHLVSANADLTFRRVFVRFDDRLQLSSAQNTANYSIPGITINSATRDASAMTVVLATSQLQEGTTYTVTVQNVRDEFGINLQVPSPDSKSFNTMQFSPGFVLKQFTSQFGGGNVDPFVTAERAGGVTYYYQCLTNFWEFNAFDTADNYGGHMKAYFVPTESGPHRFFLATDDPGRLFLSTDDNPANVVPIAREPQWAGRREWTGPSDGRRAGCDGGTPSLCENVSAPIDLVAGRRYYIDSFYTEGGGGDHMEVAVQRPTDAGPPGNGSTPIPAGFLGVYADPTGASVAITTQPVDRNITENSFATFTVAGNGNSPACGSRLHYQWRKNGMNIAGANGPSYTFGPATLADDGTLFSCAVNVVGALTTSANARLGVSRDTNGPVLVRAVGSATFDQVTVQFDELVESRSATDPFSYTITPCGTVVKGLRFTTANDAPDRDPMTFTLEGTSGNTTTGPWTLIASGNTGLSTTRFNTAPDVTFANSAAYLSYRLLFPTVRNSAGANSMQIGEIAFLDANGNDITAPGNAVIGVRATAGSPTSEIAVVGTAAGVNNFPAQEDPPKAIDDNNNTKYLNFAEVNTGIIVTPAAAAGTALTIDTITLNPNGMSVTIKTTDLQTENTLYCVSVSAVDDLAMNRIAEGSSTSFRSYVSGCGGLLFEAYNTGGGNAVSVLTSHPDFPNNPRERLTMSAFDTRTVYPDDSHEGYGARVRGLFIPPSSGNWILYLRSDDASQLWFNPAGPNAAGKALVTEETGCCNGFEAHATAPMALTGGQGYYIEVLYKEGTGGDYAQVAARLQGDASSLASIPGSQIGYPAAPGGIGGPVNITTEPQDITISAGRLVTFSVVASNPNGLPFCYQWQRDGVDVAGANGPSLTIGPVSLADDGAHFGVKIGVIGGSASSRQALLKVFVDTNAPSCQSASVSLTLSNIVVRFSEFIDPGNSQDYFNYSVTGVNVLSAGLNADGMSVTLTLDAPLAPGACVDVVIQNVEDLALNRISPDPCTLRACAPVVSCGFLAFQAYRPESTSDNSLDNTLLADPNFPSRPNEVLYMSRFDTRTVYPDDSHEGYGALMFGYFIPPTSGNWIFYLRSDDSSRLFLNPAGDSPAGKTLITEETGCCGPFAAHASAPQALTAGQFYYIEALLKEGTGGDYCQVAAKLDTDSTPPNSLTPISGALLASLADPTGASVTITRQPCDNNICLVIPNVPPPPSGNGSPLSSLDFNANDGGCTVINNRSFEGPWTYNAPTGSWRSRGQEAEIGTPGPSTRLSTPAVTVTQGGNVRLSFAHRYSFEDGGGIWDGGLVQVSVNGSAYANLPAAAFTQNGYNGIVTGNQPANPNSAAEINGQQAFISTSAGYGSGTFITSVADLGCFSPGATISVRFLGSYDTNTRNGDPAWEIDSVSLNQGVPQSGSTANFSVAVTATSGGNPNAATFIQWQRSLGGGPYANVPGANSPSLTFNPTVADNGYCYRAVIYTPGAVATSSVACLSVTQPNTPPRFTACQAPVNATEDAGPQVVPNFATGISVHSINRVPTVYANNFQSGAAGMDLRGGVTGTPSPAWTGANVSGGVLHLVDAGFNSAYGAASIGAPVQNYESLAVSWKSQVGGSVGTDGADGYSLNIGENLPVDPGYAPFGTGAEEGIGTGLIVAVDTFDNGVALDPCQTGLEIKWQGNVLNCTNIPKNDLGTGAYLRKNTFVDASVTVDPTGLATFNYDGNVIQAQLPAYTGIRASRALFWGRTGGANDNHWIDDFALQAFPYDASSAEAAQTVKFLVSNDNPSLFSVQPAVSPNGTLTYTPAPNACGTANLTVVAMDDGGTACGGTDMSAPQTCVISIGCTPDCPVIDNTRLKISVPQDGTVNFQLPVTDPDGDPLQFAVTTGPAHGAVVISITTGAGTYTPIAGYCGPDSFGFSVRDSSCTVSSTVPVNVICRNQCPLPVAKASPNAELHPNQTNTIVISANNSNACVTLDASMSTDPDGDTLTYVWLSDLNGDGTKEPIASGAVVHYCFELGEHEIMLMVDDGICTKTVSLTVEVLSAGEAVEILIDKVDNADLGRRNKRPLIATLKAAIASFDRGSCVSGVNQLEAFQNKVRAQVGHENSALADEIIALAQEILDAIECEDKN